MATIQVPADKIVTGLNDRMVFPADHIKDLAASIAEIGLQYAPLVRPVDGQPGYYQLISGECRTRAMRDILGWPVLPVEVRDLSEADAFKATLTENRRRQNLNPMDEAAGYDRGITQYGWTIEECAAFSGVRAHIVRDRLALLDLCPQAQDLVAKGSLGLKYAAILAQKTADGAVALDANFQVQALRLLSSNKSATLEWWASTVTELIGKCRQSSLFDMMDFFAEKQAETEQQNEVSLPDPDTAEAPVLGETPIDVLTNQAAWWLDLAAQWQLKNKAQARVCRANARNCKMSAELIARMAPAPVVLAPVVEMVPVAPVALPNDIIAVDALTGRVGHRVCECGRKATHQIARRVATGDGQQKRTVLTDCCNAHLPAGVAPLVGAPAQQLTFQAVAA